MFQVPNLIPFFHCLGHAKESVQVQGALKHFVTTKNFYSEWLLAPCPTPSWSSTPYRLSMTAYSIYLQLPSVTTNKQRGITPGMINNRYVPDNQQTSVMGRTPSLCDACRTMTIECTLLLCYNNQADQTMHEMLQYDFNHMCAVLSFLSSMHWESNISHCFVYNIFSSAIYS
jgi:hypothetical protein